MAPRLGYYEAPDGENEALFAADYISKYLRQGHAENGETPRAAVLYRTNSQSRLVEEAMRRYQLKYHVVGGFSFYERAEIKDMISYLKVIANPDDSIAMQRVINNPPRGLGKTTMETIERIALETGTSMWGAIKEAVRQQLLQPRALSALNTFRELIEDARAMHLGNVSREGGRRPRPIRVRWSRSRNWKKIFSIRWIFRLLGSKKMRPNSRRRRLERMRRLLSGATTADPSTPLGMTKLSGATHLPLRMTVREMRMPSPREMRTLKRIPNAWKVFVRLATPPPPASC